MATTKNDENIAWKRLEVDFIAERRLLRALYNNPEYFDDNRVSEDLLSSASTKHIYQALKNLRDKGVKATPDSLSQEYNVIDLDANNYVVSAVADDSVKNEDLTDIIDQLKDFQRRRRADNALKQAQKIISSSARLSSDDIAKVRDLIANAEDSISSKDIAYNDVMTMDQWAYDKYLPEFERREKGKVYWFRNYIFDSLIPDGPEPGQIGIIASASGSGKSTVCLNLVNNLVECQVPTMYYSLEMSSIATMDRLLSKRTGIPYSKIKNPGEDFDTVKIQLESELKSLRENKLFRFCEDGDIDLSRLEKDIVKFKQDAKVDYAIVVLDLLSMVRDFTKFLNGLNMAQGIEVAINKLSNLAKKLNVHVIGVLQLNRAAEAESSIHSYDDLDKLRPNRAQIKNANAFLERSRYVMVTFRRKMYAKLYLEPEEYEDKEDIIECYIVKQNDGELGDVAKGIFDGEHFNIMPIETQEEALSEEDKQFD